MLNSILEKYVFTLRSPSNTLKEFQLFQERLELTAEAVLKLFFQALFLKAYGHQTYINNYSRGFVLRASPASQVFSLEAAARACLHEGHGNGANRAREASETGISRLLKKGIKVKKTTAAEGQLCSALSAFFLHKEQLRFLTNHCRSVKPMW